MKTSKTFSIQFWADKNRTKNKRALLYARITVNKKRVSISLKRRVPIDIWNPKSQFLTGKSSKAVQINSYIDEVRNELFSIYQELKYTNQEITSQLIKSKFLREDQDSHTLQEIIRYHFEKIEKTLAAGSIRNFKVTEGYINKFLLQKRKTTDVFLRQLNYKFICNFEIFLSRFYPEGHIKAMSHNTVMKHIQRFRKIVTLAYHLEWIEKDPFIRWKPTFEKKEREFLSTAELSNLETYEFPIARLERVRDLFLFSCYTGISYSDIIQLTDEHISLGMDGKNWIFTQRQKTKTKIKIPLLEKAKELIIKYDDNPMTQISGTLFPKITNEKLNLYLKEIASAVGIKKNLTFHMARHTFATTVTLNNGVPIETVSKMLGHTKLATTQIYARVLDKKISEDMENLQHVLDAKEKKQKRNI